MDDEKTVEIVIPVLTQVAPRVSGTSSSTGGNHSSGTQIPPISPSQAQTLSAPVSWSDNLRKEFNEDWALRLLAVVTILVLSLLVL